MDWKLFAQLCVTVLVAISAGWLGHHLAARRDLLNERRKLRVAYLLEAYRKLEKAGNRTDPETAWPLLESAIADIQLLGSPHQVDLARQFALEMAQQHTALLDPLVNDLRDTLRSELELQRVRETVTYLRFGGSEPVSFEQTLQATIRSVSQTRIEQAEVAPLVSRELLERREAAHGFTSQVIEVWRDLELQVREKLERSGHQDIAQLGATPLLNLALEVGVLTNEQHRALRGLNTMRNLAVHGPESEVSERRVREFLDLAEAMKVVLEITESP